MGIESVGGGLVLWKRAEVEVILRKMTSRGKKWEKGCVKGVCHLLCG